VAIGMLVRSQKPSVANRLEKPVKIMSAIFLVLVIVGAVLKERAKLGEYFREVGVAALVFNLASMGVGYFVPLLAKVPRRQAVAIAMEIGIHNGTLAMFLATAVLMNDTMQIPAAIYSLIMFFTAAAFGFVVSRRVEPSAATESAAVTAPADPPS
jgi:BASS family bile acid:Na+ symporter